MEIEEQHPIPQQVSSYQFKLVGDMTLQQFFQVAGGALVALLIYSSSLPMYVKWPLILISFLTGVALAFFPLEDRPLAKWIYLFVKAIYSPTLYVWRKMPTKFTYFQAEPATTLHEVGAQIQQVQTTPSPPQQGSAKLESEEKKFLDKVTKDLSSQDTTPVIQTSSVKLPVQKSPVPEDQATKSPEVKIPQKDKLHIKPQEKPKVSLDQKPPDQPLNKEGYKLTPSVGEKTQNAQSAQFSPQATPPLPPTKPNVVVGQVVDMQGNIIENAILEIRDSEGRPARALKSNKLGHFMIVTPLANGDYQIITEKEGYIFDTINLKTKGEIIPPISIQAKSKIKHESQESIKV